MRQNTNLILLKTISRILFVLIYLFFPFEKRIKRYRKYVSSFREWCQLFRI